MVTGLPARRDPCDDKLRQATLVDFRGSNLSDAGSIPAISTFAQQFNCWAISLTLDSSIHRDALRWFELLGALVDTLPGTKLQASVF